VIFALVICTSMAMLTETKGIQQAALRSKRKTNIARAFCNNMNT
jgi:hypothetical protein